MIISFEVYRDGQAYQCVIDHEDVDLLEWGWRLRIEARAQTAYLQKRKGKLAYSMHRIILERMLGRVLLSSDRVDHKDLNGLNNTRGNLRLATQGQNLANSKARRTNKLGVKGVSTKGSKFRAQINAHGKVKALGTFDTIEEAREAYAKAAREAWGEFARLE